MARRRSRKAAKIEPAVTTLRFDLSEADPGVTASDTISLSQCASLVNRRFYRAGLNWAVAGFTLFTSGLGQVSISKIPDTWVASNAWEKGFHSWMRMNNDALEEAESVRPKFLDFKVFMDAEHHSQGVGNNLLPLDFAGNPYTEGTWDMSDVIVPLTTSPGSASRFELIWTGANFPGAGASGNNAVSLIEGYAASRGLPDILDPNTPDDAGDAAGATPENWMSAMFNDGTTQDSAVLDNMIDENNQAPYPFENDGTATDTQYPGGANQAPGLEVHDLALATATVIGGKTHMRGGTFQGGLIRVENASVGPWDITPQLFVHLVPGPSRGYLTTPQKDV